MHALLLALCTFSASSDVASPTAGPALLPAEPLVPFTDEREPHFAPNPRPRSKKEIWFLEKALRPDVHISGVALGPRPKATASRPKPGATANQRAEAHLAEPGERVGTRIQPVTTLFNIWNREALPLIVGRAYKRPFQLFLRDHYTKQATQADTRLAGVLAAAALRFHAPRVEIVSGFRSPKYNLMLRKKGHQVARESQHMQGTAVDFRIRGVEIETLREFVRSLRLGGVGYYPHTRFIHADTGKVRYWQGS
jgi:Bacterial protein of unknown function (DUF882)